MSKRVLTFSLWGDKTMYNVGAIKNAHLAQHFYPNFECWFYVHIETVPPSTIEALQALSNVKLIIKYGDLTTCKPMMWRYEAIDDPAVEIMLSRDTDTRIWYREKLSVDNWLASGKRFHIIRDHPHHKFCIMGGMFGTKKIPGVNWKERMATITQSGDRNYDQDFLRDHIYPFIYNDAWIHANFYKIEGEENVFQISYNHYAHFIGEYVYEDDSRSEGHINDLKRYLHKTTDGYRILDFTDNLPELCVDKIVVANPVVAKIHIITTFYISNTGSPLDAERNVELQTALLKNVASESVEKIHLFVDNEDAVQLLGNITNNSDKICIISIGKQPMYYDFFNYILTHLPNHICMITNADIYLHTTNDDLINRLVTERYVYALTRYEEDMSHTLIDNLFESYDCYIFNSAFLHESILDKNLQYYQNSLGIETRVVTSFFNNGFKPLNPCYQLKIVHLHKSNLRNYKDAVYLNSMVVRHGVLAAYYNIVQSILL
jgi:hypothetical protein